jgi:hypothetical protein
LLVFGLEQEARAAPGSRRRLSPHVFRELYEICVDGHALEARLGGVQVGEIDHVFQLCLRHRVSLRAGVPPLAVAGYYQRSLRDLHWRASDGAIKGACLQHWE